MSVAIKCAQMRESFSITHCGDGIRYVTLEGGDPFPRSSSLLRWFMATSCYNMKISSIKRHCRQGPSSDRWCDMNSHKNAVSEWEQRLADLKGALVLYVFYH